MQSNANVLQIENIITRFNTQDGKVFAVNGISFDLKEGELLGVVGDCLLYTSPSPRDKRQSRMPSSA